MKLRDYQNLAVWRSLADLDRQGASLVVVATGGGKTAILGALMREMERRGKLGRTLVLQHTELLSDQNIRTLSAMTHPLPFGLLTGKKAKRPKHERVLVATRDTIANSLDHIGQFDTLAIDEAHHAASPVYRRIIGALRERNPALRLYGMTATPERADGAGLDTLFGPEPSIVVGMPELIAAGWLIAPRVKALDLPGVRAALSGHEWAAGDDADASRLLNVRVTHEEVVRHHRAEAGDRQSIYYCPDVAHAEALAVAFAEDDIEAVCLHANSPTILKREVSRALAAGRGPRVVTNAMLLTEGFDAPPVACVGLLRGFVSSSLWMQALGRGSRPLWPKGQDPNEMTAAARKALLAGSAKPEFLVLDFVGACERHGSLAVSGDLAGRARKVKRSSDISGFGRMPETLTAGLGDTWLQDLDLLTADLAEVDIREWQNEWETVPNVYREGTDVGSAGEMLFKGQVVAVTKKAAAQRGLRYYLWQPCPVCGSWVRDDGKCANSENHPETELTPLQKRWEKIWHSPKYRTNDEALLAMGDPPPISQATAWKLFGSNWRAGNGAAKVNISESNKKKYEAIWHSPKYRTNDEALLAMGDPPPISQATAWKLFGKSGRVPKRKRRIAQAAAAKTPKGDPHAVG